MEFVIGIDSSTQSTKAIAWDCNGNSLAEGRSSIPMSELGDGGFEQNPEDWWVSFIAAVSELGTQIDLSKARAIAISNQRETVGFLDQNGEAIRPALVWLDERARDSVAEFNAEFSPEFLHRITGKPPDLTPVVYRLYWLAKHEPGTLAATHIIVDVHGYLTLRLTGKYCASWTSADPMGCFDITTKEWSEEIIFSIGLSRSQFAGAMQPGSCIGMVSEAAAEATGLPRGLVVIAAGGDGQCAGLGVNAVRAGRAYLNLGTAQIMGAWGAEPIAARDWRTMCSPTGDGYFYEGVLRAGTFLIDWFVRKFLASESDPAVLSALEDQASELPVGSHGVVVSPYLSGCMNPHWRMDAAAAIVGMRADHGSCHVYRAILEALTGEAVRTVIAMKARGVAIDRIIAVGGGANSRLWCQMLADASGLPLQVSDSLEASSLGAAVTAAKGLGWYPDFDSAAAGMTHARDPLEPSLRNRVAWGSLLERQDQLNRLLITQT